MRVLASLGLVLTLASTAVAQDTSVVIRDTSLSKLRVSPHEMQARTYEVARRVADMAQQSRVLALRSLQAFSSRPRLGIAVYLNARESDKYGAYVSAVTPGGPAAKAGIRSGDIITRVDGTSLTVADSIRREVGQSAPGLRLIELAARLDAGKTVEVEFRRGSDTRKVSFVPVNNEGLSVAATEVPMALRLFEGTKWPPNGNFPSFSAFGGPLADLELAPLNEKLGAYFGVSEGVLVIDVPEKDNLGLVPGDVVSAIDGRKVNNPNQLMRVLRTYEKNEEFKLQVTRQKRPETLVAKLP